MWSTIKREGCNCHTCHRNLLQGGGSHGCDHMVVGFTTTYAIGAHQLMEEVGME